MAWIYWIYMGLVNTCEMPFKIDEAMWKTFKSDCAVTGQEKSERKFLTLAERRKTVFKSKETAERMRSDIRISGLPRLHLSEEHRDIRMIHL